MYKIIASLIPSLLILIALPIAAGETQKPHTHGHVQLNIAIAQNEILLDLIAPGADVVGFEHAPQNKNQQHALSKVLLQLKNPKNLFSFSNKANCKIIMEKVNEDLSVKLDTHNHHNNHLPHDNHNHQHNHHKSEAHGEFFINYLYECTNIKYLDAIKTNWFNVFNTKTMKVNLVTKSEQKSLELNKSKTVIQLN